MFDRDGGSQHGSGFLFRVKRGRFLRSVLCFLAAVLAAASFPAAEEAGGGEVLHLNAALLTRDLGDPRDPGNVKLVVGFPEALSRRTSGARAEDFRVYVHPAGIPAEEGVSERYRARGVYLWNHRGRMFLDARTVPAQEEEGLVAVRVLFAPGGAVLAEGVADGHLSYTSDLVDVVLAVDVSRSMLYNDPQKRRVAAARTFIELARQGGGIGSVGLVTFNHRASTNSPLLPLADADRLIRLLDTVGADGLTNLDGPIRNSLQELSASRNPVIILLSDGRNEGSRYRASHLQAAERGTRIFTVGLSEEADHELLKEMADTTGGIYFRAVTDADLPEIYARLAAELGKRQLLNAEVLDAVYGEKTYPLDGTITRLVALADGGARIAAIGGGGMVTTGMSGVLMGSPEPGPWTFAWSSATPGESTLALFGDTKFFLDLFPPQLLGDRLGVGATLARGTDALVGGSVWIEPLPGVLASRMQLFDDGRHGDGRADDGVYAGETVVPGAPERFELTVRAAGTAWDEGEFIRQAAGPAIRLGPAPPAATARLSGDIDFGVLFPGETGSAGASIELDAPGPQDVFLELSWADAGADWPDFASELSMDPGTRALRLEITIPETARPGAHTGVFRVTDGEGVDAQVQARVVVGAVDFRVPGGVDLGDVPPGTFVSRVLDIPYRADKPAALAASVAGSADAAVTAGAAMLPGGQGTLPLEIVVTAPLDKPEGEYTATVRLAAGPGIAEIPVTWRVRRYAAAAPGFVPPEGLPSAPELPASSAPLRKTPELSENFWETGAIAEAPAPVDSPWEKTERLLRRPGDALSGGAAVTGSPEGFTFPAPAQPPQGAGFWSAWWLYILAALLLLLLLLLLLAYLLYRLGKSALARFLLVSALANIILMLAFILLLSAGVSAPAARMRSVTVNLVDGDFPGDVRLTAAEESLFSGAAADAAGSAGAAGGGAAETTLDQLLTPASSGGQLVEAKETRLPENDAPETELADALRPAAMALENTEERRLRRTNSSVARTDRETEMPASAPAAVTEQPAAPAQAARADASAEEPEARPEIEVASPSENPVWSEEGKPRDSAVSDGGLLLAEAAGMETARHDNSLRRLEPRAGRRSVETVSAVYPEPRVAIDDPARDTDMLSAARSEQDDSDTGAPEFRVADRTTNAEGIGEKPGSVLPDGADRLADSLSAPLPQEPAARAATQELSRPAGAARSSRSFAEQAAPPLPDAAAVSTVSSSSAPADSSASAAGGAAAPREERFDGETQEAPGGADGMPGASGAARTRRDAPGGAGAAPSPLDSGGASGDDRAEYVPPAGTAGGAAEGQRRDNATGRTGRTESGVPSGSDNVPGGGGQRSPASASGGNADSSGRARSEGTGEGRFDEQSSGDGVAAPADRGSGRIDGGGGTALADASSGAGAIPYDGGAGEWRRIDRRSRARSMSVAASAVDMDSLLLVVGDFSRLPDSAAENLFARFARGLGRGITVEERLLSPADENLSDTLLALATPEQVAAWSDAYVRAVADYLERGGHIWLDAAGTSARDAARAAMERLAAATGGEFAPLPASHQLAEDGAVDALAIDGELAAIATHRGWRNAWRFAEDGGGDGDTLRFLVRTVNYFLSGDADSGIVLEPGAASGGMLVQPYREIIPDSLSSARTEGETAVWDDFGPATSTAWRMPSWSDAGAVSAISDGEGARALKVDLAAAEKGRAAVYRTLQPAQDFTGVSAMTLDAYYDGAGEAGLSMVFTVNEDGTWRDYETQEVRLETGWNSIRFDLDSTAFRALTPGGTDDGRLPPSRARTGRAGFFLYRGGRTAAAVLFRNIRLVRR